MADDDFAPPTRLMNFVSQDQLEEARRNRGERVDDGTAQRNRPLYEILKENKDKRDADFNERFKHRPPKALDEDETEFLDKLEMSRREYERQMADEEAQQLRSFQAAVEAQSTTVHELKETPHVPNVQEHRLVGRKNPPTPPLGMIIKAKTQVKKAKLDQPSSAKSLEVVKRPIVDGEKLLESVKRPNVDCRGKVSDAVNTPNVDREKQLELVKRGSMGNEESNVVSNCGLVSYSDESEDDD